VPCALAIGSLALAQDAIRPRLEPDARVIETLRNLEENQAVVLGKARVVGDFNDVARRYGLERTGPRGRNFTVKMVWAPERKRALFAGANHATPHRLNDVWEFDLASLTWVLLYAPDNSRSYRGLGSDYSDVRFEDGILVTRRGGPAIIGHTWWGITYDPEQREMLFMNTWPADHDKAIQLVGGDPSQRFTGPPLWSFTPQSGKWQMIRTQAPWPKAPAGAMLEYVDELKGSVWHSNNWNMRGTWLFDSRSRKWTDLKPNAERADFKVQAPSLEQVGYYDPVRRILVSQRFSDTFHFELRTRTWKQVHDAPDKSDRVPYGHDARTPFYYDPVSGHGLLFDLTSSALWSYDPGRIAWTRLQPSGDPVPAGKRRLAYFDPARNVLVVIDDTTVWAYRYRSR
jgi:hypothetical protein